jgi:hypothetical protein
MNKRLQSGILLTALCTALSAGAVFAQSAHPDRPPQREQSPPPQRQQPPPPKSNAGGKRPPAQNPNANRPPRQNPPQNRSADRAPNQPRAGSVDRPNTRPQNQPQFDRNPQRYDNRPSGANGSNRPENFAPNNPRNRPSQSFDRPDNYSDRPNYDRNNGARMTPRQQVGVGSPRPLIDRMRDMTPQQRERQLQSSRVFQNLAPEQQSRIRNQFNQWDRMSSQQRADLREKENTWRSLTPDQRQYIKGDVMPRWRQMPWQRQQVIQQKLGVLQNMPESARNRRLADPNFTRGMTEEDRTMLHDLSHLHVGGAPDPPSNEP